MASLLTVAPLDASLAAGILKVATGILCIYEGFAIFGERLHRARCPTISVVCGRHPILKPVVLGGLAAHLYRKASQ